MYCLNSFTKEKINVEDVIGPQEKGQNGDDSGIEGKDGDGWPGNIGYERLTPLSTILFFANY